MNIPFLPPAMDSPQVTCPSLCQLTKGPLWADVCGWQRGIRLSDGRAPRGVRPGCGMDVGTGWHIALSSGKRDMQRADRSQGAVPLPQARPVVRCHEQVCGRRWGFQGPPSFTSFGGCCRRASPCPTGGRARLGAWTWLGEERMLMGHLGAWGSVPR